MTVQHPEQQRLGYDNGRNVLDEQDVIEIRGLIAEHELSRTEIAQRYGISKSSVQNIAEGRAWCWLDEGSYAAMVRAIAARVPGSRPGGRKP